MLVLSPTLSFFDIESFFNIEDIYKSKIAKNWAKRGKLLVGFYKQALGMLLVTINKRAVVVE